jgi:mannan endo-1,4-beta-mannosidase
LANEPRRNGCATSIIIERAKATSAYVKSLDSKHIVTLEDEGFGLEDAGTSYPFQFGEGTDWAANLAIDTVDFGTIHLYPTHWGQEASGGYYWINAYAKADATLESRSFWRNMAMRQRANLLPGK